ncbi:glucuronyl esterase domain-containing protein [Sorangium sp. So ce542]|uniref:glucuronyl esterase domain-containing protein n=1 Tax=Sorangium sp. So ce542 TaxID=3133316 RepID=UPI003F5F6954
MTTAADWRCRRAELSRLIQHFQYGPYPPSPENVTGTLNGDRLTVKVEHGGKSISFDATVSLPNGSGPFPAFIVISSPMPGLTASAVNDKGIGYITIDPNGIAADAKPPRRGKLYDLYGSDSTTGALMAWGWATHRVIDALEETPRRQGRSDEDRGDQILPLREGGARRRCVRRARRPHGPRRVGRRRRRQLASGRGQIEDHIGWVADDHSHGVMTTREADAILGFAERFLLGKDVTTEQWDESASPPTLSWSAP